MIMSYTLGEKKIWSKIDLIFFPAIYISYCYIHYYMYMEKKNLV